MSSPAYNVWGDVDLQDLLQVRPDLVAIADAVAEAGVSTRAHPTRRRDSRRRIAFAIAAVLVVSATPALAFSHSLRHFLGFGDNQPVFGRARAAATLTSHVDLSAPSGSTITLHWKLWGHGHNGQVIQLRWGNLFARVINPSGTVSSSANASLRRGTYTARVRVPQGGIGKIQIGIHGWSDTPTGRHPAPVLFVITNNPTP